MKYTVKDVCKIYNITRDTLRYYEKEGIIHPTIDHQNHYRYYDDWDINYIGECKKYQPLGFSIKEVVKMIQGGTLDDFIAITEDKQKHFTNLCHFYELALKFNEQYIERLKGIEDYLNHFSFINAEDRYIISNRHMFEYSLDTQLLDIFHGTLDEYTFYDNTVLIKKEDYMKANDVFSWGNCITSTFIPYVSTSKEDFYLLPKHRCLYTVIDAGERWNFTYKLFDEAMAYLKEKQYQLDGDIYGNLLTRVHKEDKFCRYIEVFIPIKKENA